MTRGAAVTAETPTVGPAGRVEAHGRYCDGATAVRGGHKKIYRQKIDTFQHTDISFDTINLLISLIYRPSTRLHGRA